MTSEQWQLDRIYKWNSCLARLHLPGRGWTNVSPLFNDWDVCRITTFLCYGQLGTSFYLRESLCRREEVLSAPRISSFWRRSVSLSLLDVFLLVVFGLFVFWSLFCFCIWKTSKKVPKWRSIFSPKKQSIKKCQLKKNKSNQPTIHINQPACALGSPLRIVDRPQDVLMTVRASSAHGMS